MDPDAEFQQKQDIIRQNNNPQYQKNEQNEQNEMNIYNPIQNIRHNQVSPLIVQQQQQDENLQLNPLPEANEQQLQMQINQQQEQIQFLQMQNQMQAQMQQNQMILQNQGIRNQSQRNEVETYTKQFEDQGNTLREVLMYIATSMIQNCGFKVEGVQLRYNVNLYQDEIPDIIQNKIIRQLKEINPDVDEKKIKESKIIQCVNPLLNMLIQKWKTAFKFSILMMIYQWIYIFFVLILSTKLYTENLLSWLGVVEGFCSLFNLGALIYSKRKFDNKPVIMACKVSIIWWILHLFGMYNMLAEGSQYGKGSILGPIAIIIIFSMFFCILFKGNSYTVLKELERVYQRIFVIIGEDPITILEK